jgi:hypothetical protein
MEWLADDGDYQVLRVNTPRGRSPRCLVKVPSASLVR